MSKRLILNRTRIHPKAYSALLLLIISTMMSIQMVCAQIESTEKQFDWNNFQTVLNKHLKRVNAEKSYTTFVNYYSLKNEPLLKTIEQQLNNYDPIHLTKSEKLAFYVNSYNFFAINLMVKYYPIDSIKDIGSIFSPVWGKKVGAIGKKRLSLDDIEHGILRPLGDPRIHFALVCASLSCPNLRTEVYASSRIDAQFDDQTKVFLENNKKGLRITGDQLYITKLFDWFEDDFDTHNGPLAFIKKYYPLPEKINDYDFLDYLWSPNDRPFN